MVRMTETLWPFAVLGLLAGIYPALVILAMVTSGSNQTVKSWKENQ